MTQPKRKQGEGTPYEERKTHPHFLKNEKNYGLLNKTEFDALDVIIHSLDGVFTAAEYADRIKQSNIDSVRRTLYRLSAVGFLVSKRLDITSEGWRGVCHIKEYYATQTAHEAYNHALNILDNKNEAA